jgi:isoleucyl-tRNA synthetase
VGSIEYTEDTKLGENILKQLTDTYRKLRNTFRFLLGNLYDFDREADSLALDQLDPIDQWALSRLQELITTVSDAYMIYDFQKSMQAITLFCNVELSSFYADVLKDRLYTLLPTDTKRRSSQTVFHKIASVLCRLLAPVLVHTAEEVWQIVKPGKSVHLANWPEVKPEYKNAKLEAEFAEFFAVRDAFNAALDTAVAEETQRQTTLGEAQGLEGQSLQAFVKEHRTFSKSVQVHATVTSSAELNTMLTRNFEWVREGLMVPKLTLLAGSELAVTVALAPGKKCERSWFVLEDVGDDPEFPDISARQAAIVRQLTI